MKSSCVKLLFVILQGKMKTQILVTFLLITISDLSYQISRPSQLEDQLEAAKTLNLTDALYRQNRNAVLSSSISIIGKLIVKIPGRLMLHYPKARDVLSWTEKHLKQGLFEVVSSAVRDLCSAVALTNSIRPVYAPDSHEISIVLASGGKGKAAFPLSDAEGILQSPQFYTERNTTIFITGWGFNSTENYIPFLRLAEAYKCQPRYNFLVIDVGKHIDSLFTWAAFDSETVGEQVGQALVKIHESVATENFHLIGHGVGAHVAGSAARYFQKHTGEKLERVTGLDPAAFCSVTAPGDGLRGLRRGDAMFVDIIHSNSGVFGVSTSLGDLDFYPNGVVPLQPGCHEVICSHLRAIDFFAETVFPNNDNHFRATECSSLKGIISNQCNGKQIPMGLFSPTHIRGDYFLLTKSEYPYGKNVSPSQVPECAFEALL